MSVLVLGVAPQLLANTLIRMCYIYNKELRALRALVSSLGRGM
jgi:hypothetical protein